MNALIRLKHLTCIYAGPDSEGVIQRILAWDAFAVLGNNDRKVLDAYEAYERDGIRNTIIDSVPLSASSLQFLRGLPAYIRFPEHNLIVVHAGVPPGRTPEVWLCAALNFILFYFKSLGFRRKRLITC